ncbi:MAG: hypothetical protein NZX77_15130 [Polyangiaceae bacterium]|nr:hypothetical protein [Polyangiaceae bacterium]
MTVPESILLKGREAQREGPAAVLGGVEVPGHLGLQESLGLRACRGAVELPGLAVTQAQVVMQGSEGVEALPPGLPVVELPAREVGVLPGRRLPVLQGPPAGGLAPREAQV